MNLTINSGGQRISRFYLQSNTTATVFSELICCYVGTKRLQKYPVRVQPPNTFYILYICP